MLPSCLKCLQLQDGAGGITASLGMYPGCCAAGCTSLTLKPGGSAECSHRAGWSSLLVCVPQLPGPGTGESAAPRGLPQSLLQPLLLSLAVCRSSALLCLSLIQDSSSAMQSPWRQLGAGCIPSGFFSRGLMKGWQLAAANELLCTSHPRGFSHCLAPRNKRLWLAESRSWGRARRVRARAERGDAGSPAGAASRDGAVLLAPRAVFTGALCVLQDPLPAVGAQRISPAAPAPPTCTSP